MVITCSVRKLEGRNIIDFSMMGGEEVLSKIKKGLGPGKSKSTVRSVKK